MKLTLQQVQNLNEEQWDRLKEMAILHTSLVREHINLFNIPDAEDRRKEIKKQIAELRRHRDKILVSAS